jgi:hypothetical protein
MCFSSLIAFSAIHKNVTTRSRFVDVVKVLSISLLRVVTALVVTQGVYI